jgi:hypothetical protein
MPIIIDLIMMGLLVGVIIHSVRLSKSLSGFKQLHSEILPLMQEYTKTVQSSFQQIDSMKKISGESDHISNSRVPAALTIKKDLEFLVGRSEELADHLEFMIRSGRDQEFKPLTTKGTFKKTSQKIKDEIVDITHENEIIKLVAQKQFSPNETVKTTKTKGKVKIKTNFKPIMESFFLTKTAKKLLGKDGETTHAA